MELINKKDAIHAVLHNTGDAAVAAVQNIKPINPHGELREMLIDEMIDRANRPKSGEWIPVGDGTIYVKCSVCGEEMCCRGNYCPNCGAKMRGEQE